MDNVALKVALPKLVSSLKDWFSIDLTIKLFGVEVFHFEWPPRKSDSSNL